MNVQPLPSLPFAGQTLESVYVEYGAYLEFRECTLTFGTEFSLETSEGGFRLDPDNYLDENFNQLSRLAGVVVTAASYDETGDLKIEFANGARITTGPYAGSEAWNLACGDSNGLKIVCLPSGGLAIWDAIPDTSEEAQAALDAAGAALLAEAAKYGASREQ